MAQSADDARADEKARYDALFAQGRAKRRDISEAPGNPTDIPENDILWQETLPGSWGWSRRIPRGQTLRIKATGPNSGVSVLLYNAADPTERFNAGDTVKIQWSAALQRGRVLFSDMGRVLASITDDTFGRNDALAGGSTPLSNEQKYGDATLRSTRGNFILLAAKHGLSKADVPPCLTLFAPVAVDAEGRFTWEGDGASAGDYVDLRAEMDLLVFVSNCPHPLAPGAYDPKPVDLMVWQSPPPAADDFCRTATEEAIRGFENTDPLFR